MGAMAPLIPALLNSTSSPPNRPTAWATASDDLALVGHVGDAGGRHVRAELGHRLGQPPGVEPGQVDPGALGREQPGGGQADAALAAGDEGDLVV
jgi:hypothetical protein